MIRYFYILAFALFIFSAPQLNAQKTVSIKKRFKEAQTAIKNGSGQENIERILLDSMALPATPQHIRANGYNLCALLQQSLNDGFNMKAYLKQNIDTVKFFKTVFNIYNYTLRSDSADESGKYEDKNIKLRAKHRQNLLGGGKFFLRKDNWTDAYDLFDMFLKTHTTETDSILGNVAYWATVCGMNVNDPHRVLKHVDMAISEATSADAAALAEYKARSYLALGDSLAWVAILEEGINYYPGYSYFFLNLMDYYMRHGKTDLGMARTDSLIRMDSDCAMYWLALSMFALGQKDYETCVKMSDECLKRESENVDALYNKGISLLNMALHEERTTKRRALYRSSLAPMEKVRELLPDEPERWGSPLYRIYLNLNMGDKFKEIDHLLEKISNNTDTKSQHNVENAGESVTKTTHSIDKHLGGS